MDFTQTPSETNPFIPFGAQYYRAPTPEPQHWATDLDRFREAGFSTLKYWAQWRWNTPRKGDYYFEDLDRLMDLAAERGLGVVINTLFDSAPAWLFHEDYDCRMLTADGRRVDPMAHACRQIGGTPGPCYNHPEAIEHRMDFLAATVERYAKHPALTIWDTWNEPELTVAILRQPLVENQVCYCEHCERLFKQWLEGRYGSLDAVNARWGRNYQSFDELELPVGPTTFGDAIDWRTFHIGTITNEQRRRVEVVRQHDPDHIVMCHTVPMPVFNPVTCASDDWELAELGDWVGNSLGTDPLAADLIRSAGKERVAINSEIHALPGRSLARPQPLDMEACKHYVYGPLAHGIKGFLFWQYRPELLGVESPAWGMTRPDGSTTPWLEHFAQLNQTLQDDADFYWNAQPEGPEVGIFYHPSNHIFCWCAQGSFDLHDSAVLGAYRALFEANFRVRFVHPMDLASGALDGLKTIVYPFPYVLDNATAHSLRQWVEAGGTLVGEAFFGNLALETSLHSETVPGYGFDEVFGAREGIGTPYSEVANLYASAQGVDVAAHGPAIQTTVDLPDLKSGHEISGYLIRTPLELNGAETLAQFDDGSSAVSRHAFGKGQAILSGTMLSAAARQQPAAKQLLAALATLGDDRPRPTVQGDGALRVDTLRHGEECAIVIENLAGKDVTATVRTPGIESDATALIDPLTAEPIEGTPEGWAVALAAGAVNLYRVEKR